MAGKRVIMWKWFWISRNKRVKWIRFSKECERSLTIRLRKYPCGCGLWEACHVSHTELWCGSGNGSESGRFNLVLLLKIDRPNEVTSSKCVFGK
jgi:hypothetical protein